MQPVSPSILDSTLLYPSFLDQVNDSPSAGQDAARASPGAETLAPETLVYQGGEGGEEGEAGAGTLPSGTLIYQAAAATLTTETLV